VQYLKYVESRFRFGHVDILVEIRTRNVAAAVRTKYSPDVAAVAVRRTVNRILLVYSLGGFV
jgi:hypothetical protein